MKQVVDSGTASALSGRSYTVAGKTGSAEFDEEGHSHSWFIGYSNVDDPDLVDVYKRQARTVPVMAGSSHPKVTSPSNFVGST